MSDITIDSLRLAIKALERNKPVSKMHVGSEVWKTMTLHIATVPAASAPPAFMSVSVIIDHQHPYREPEFE